METAIEHAVDDGMADSLLERARRRDTGAFESLYRAHRGRVYALALRLTRDARAADELTQDVFVQAWKALPQFRGDSRLSTWLHTITVRGHVQIQRSRRRRAEREAAEPTIETVLLRGEACDGGDGYRPGASDRPAPGRRP